jgi:acetyl esterase/lipase
VALICPVTDLLMEGDTHRTLADADAMLTEEALRPGYDAYADPGEQKLPYVSPVHADFAAGFPPTLFLAGGRERLLSDSIRMHRAIRAAGGQSRLEVFEAMPHSFLGAMADAPEGRAALAELQSFWTEHMDGPG